MEEGEGTNPLNIWAAVIILIMFVIAIFIVSIIVTQQQQAGAGPYYDQSFTVTDPTVDQDLQTGKAGLSDIIVTKWDGATWTDVASGDWTYNTNTGLITVSATGL